VATYFEAQSKGGWPTWPRWFLVGATLRVGACFHDAGPGSNARTSVRLNAVEPTGRLSQIMVAELGRE